MQTSLASTERKDAAAAKASHLLTRPGLLAILSLAVGHVLAAGLGSTAWQPWVALMLAACSVLLISRSHQYRFAVGFCAFFAGVGGLQEARQLLRESNGREAVARLGPEGTPLATVAGIVDETPRRTPAGWTIMLRPGTMVESKGLQETIPARMTIRLPRTSTARDESMVGLVPGDPVHAIGPLEPLPPRQVDGEDRHWLSGRGAVGVVRARQFERLAEASERGPWGRFLEFASLSAHSVEQRLYEALPKREAAILVSMTLGRTDGMSVEQRDSFRRTGLAHLFAVSGLHTMLVGGLVLWLLHAAGLRTGPRFLVLAAVLLFFAGLQGMRPSVVRACLTLLVLDGRHLLGRPVEPLAALGTLAAILAMISPLAIWQIDFQMTFLCAGALVMLGPWMVAIKKELGPRLGWGVKSWLAVRAVQLAIASAVLQLVLSPVLMTTFGDVSVIAPLANLIVLPIATLCIKGAFLALVVAMAFPGIGSSVLGLLRYPLDIIEEVVYRLGSLPVAAVEGAPLPLWAVALLYTLLLGAAWNRERLLAQPRRRPWAFAPAGIAIVALFVWLPVGAPEPRALDIWFLDVGQGDAVLIRTPDGTALMFDAGPPAAGNRVVELLRRRGVTQLQAMIASHADADHIGGMPAILRDMPVEQVIVGGSIAPTVGFEELRLTVERLSVPVTTVRRGATMDIGGGAVLTVLHPDEEAARMEASRNDTSVVLMLEYAGVRVMLPGDAERDAKLSMLAADVPLKADVLMAGHHGARTSTSAEFLDAVNPRYAVISCGRLNNYGHPAPEVLQLLSERNIEPRRTDRHGTIRLRIRSSGDLVWTTER